MYFHRVSQKGPSVFNIEANGVSFFGGSWFEYALRRHVCIESVAEELPDALT